MTNLETPVHQEILFLDDFHHQNSNVISIFLFYSFFLFIIYEIKFKNF